MRHPESIVLTARYGGVTAGFAIMRYGDDVAHLNLLAVDPAHRRRGVARKIMMWLEETALTAGTFIIGLELRATNEAALAFYAALGYRELGRVSGYYQGIENAIRMARDVRTSREAVPGLKQQPAP
jgi:ribosomal-protein-alanine N-acetyltransferase